MNWSYLTPPSAALPRKALPTDRRARSPDIVVSALHQYPTGNRLNKLPEWEHPASKVRRNSEQPQRISMPPCRRYPRKSTGARGFAVQNPDLRGSLQFTKQCPRLAILNSVRETASALCLQQSSGKQRASFSTSGGPLFLASCLLARAKVPTSGCFRKQERGVTQPRRPLRFGALPHSNATFETITTK